jgi:hypothetical protein
VLTSFFIGLGAIGALTGIILFIVSFVSGATHEHAGASNAGLRLPAIGVFIFAAILFLGTQLLGRDAGPEGVVIVAYRKDALSWWQQNKATVLITVVVAIVFYLLGMVKL